MRSQQQPRLARLAAPVLGLLAALAVAPPSARADSVPSVTLVASAATVSYGQQVTLSGAISLPAAAEKVSILDDGGVAVAQATTDTAGAFSTPFTPERTVAVHATWRDAWSAPVEIGVRAALTLRLSAVRLFGTAVVRGAVSPPDPGATVAISLLLRGSVAAAKDVATDGSGAFRASFPIEEPGTYRARATFAAAGHLPAAQAAGPRSTQLPSLRVGSRGAAVDLLERRLASLHYRLLDVGDAFDLRTADAVMAFTKVQGMARRGTVDAAVWRALARPTKPRARSTAAGFHIEVDQTRQVLYTVRDGEITNILHVSTGKPSTPTRDGSFHVYRKLAGQSAGGLYYPSYFDGLRAVHGWTDVPPYPASHGCVRVPYWNAKWIFGLAKIGAQLLIYH